MATWTKLVTTANLTDITTVGTVGTGTWNGSVIASDYLDSDTAHLSTTQTFSGAKTFSSAVKVNNTLHMAKDVSAGGAYLTIENEDATSSETEYCGIKALIHTQRNAGEIRFGKDSGFGSDANADSHIKLYTATDNTNTLALTLDSSQNAAFSGTITIPEKLIHAGDTNTYLQFGDDTVTLTAGGTNAIVCEDDEVTISGATAINCTGDFVIKDNAGGTNVQIVGNEGDPATIELWADDGDDNIDKWKIRNDPDSDNDLAFENYTSGSYVDKVAFTTSGEVRAANEVTAYYGSDIAMKKNIKLIENPLEKVLSLGGYNFDWKAKVLKDRGGIDDYFVRENDVGIIAQEVEKVLPEIVAVRDDGTKGVKYEKIIPLLIESVKEIFRLQNKWNERIEDLENGNR